MLPALLLAAVQFASAQPSLPTLTSISPPNGAQGANVTVTLTGTNFVTGATVAASGAGITVSGVTVISATQIRANFAVAASAAPGPGNITVTTSGGTTGAKVFTIKPPPPTLTSISPSSGIPGTSVLVTLTGTNFVSGAALLVSNSGTAVSGLTVVSATQITATFTVAAKATPRRGERRGSYQRRRQRCRAIYSEAACTHADFN